MNFQPTWHAAMTGALLDPRRPCPPGFKVWNGSDPETRLAVYRNNIVVSLIDALATTFPVTKELVGSEFFQDMARAFIRQHPPTTRVLTWLGLPFADFIENFAPAGALPYLADVARLEMLRVRAYHAADARGLALPDFADLLEDPDRLGAIALVLHPCVCPLASEWAVVSIWGAHQGLFDLADVNPDKSECCIVFREGLAVRVMKISLPQYVFLTALQRGDNLFMAADCAYEAEDNQARAEPFDLPSTLALLIKAGLVCSFKTVQERCVA
jgi:hypothetical protein